MNMKIVRILEEDCKRNGWDKWDNDDQLLEQLREYDLVHKELLSEHRWWNLYRHIVKVNDTYIGWIDADATGDMSTREMGYEVDLNTICEMIPIQKTITVYEKKEEK